MALVPGLRLGAYEILTLIGSGGMGEVYRARDIKLKRDVALKVLPDSFTHDSDRLARFQREAEVLASLNHPHIAQIHGLEESEGIRALVLEFVDGPTLADRIAQGPIPVEEALPIARQIAEALEAAHEHGIVHRDLKPANIKLRSDGTVKVLDFGLAKAAQGATSGSLDLANSPTLTSPAMMTGVGVILGTAAYMSPEQAKGRAADKRSDVWAFGCVLFEMLTGKRAFEGEDVSDTLAAVLRGEPAWAVLPSDTPAHVRDIVRCCLEKDRRMRIPDVSAIRFLLIAAHSHGAAAATSVIVPPRSLWKRAIPMVATAVVAGAIAAGAAWTLKPSPKPVVARLTIPLPEGQQFSNPGRQLIAISPDGTHVVYVANLQLYLRSMWESEPRPIPGTDAFGNVLNPVFSPDGHSIGFIASADRTLKRIAVTGGTAVTVCPASAVFGMSWSGEDILFGQPGGVVRVSASGGKPELLLSVMNGEIAHGPQMLPGGDAVLFTLLSASSTIQTTERWDKAQIVVHSLKTGERKTLIEGGADGRYLATGHLVYALGGVLFGVPFDLTRLTIAGVPTPIVEGVRRAAGGATGTAQFSISTGGSLVYLPGPTTSSNLYDLGLLDLKGGSAPLKLRPGPYQQPRISPDSKSVAFHSDDGKDVVVWVYDLSGVASMRRLTLDGRNRFPVWSGDGQRVTFQSDRDGDLGIFWQRADGTGKAERLTKSEPGISHVPETWSPDGKFLLFSVSKDSNWTLWMYSLHEKSGTPLAGINSENPLSATFSRDGRWFAYSSRGRARGPGRGTLTYVQPFPANGTKYEIGQGSHPMWSADSKQLFAAPGPGVLGSFTINTQPHFAFGNFVRVTQVIDPEPAFPRGYDMGSDGKVLGLVVPGTTDSTGAEHVQVVLNWFEELRQRVPLK